MGKSSSPTTIADDAERHANLSVSTIRRCVDSLRSVEEFAPSSSSTLSSSVTASTTMRRRRRPRGNDDGDERRELASALPYRRLVSDGIELDAARCACCPFHGTDASTSSADEGGNGDHHDDERRNLALRILLPLLRSVSHWYGVLDSLPPLSPLSPDAPAPPDKSGGGGPSSKHGSKTRKGSKKPPPPPRGLLSIRDYTNVAVVLELTVCISILPNLEERTTAAVDKDQKHTTGATDATVSERIKRLPRALRGRVSVPALAWGCAYASCRRRRDEGGSNYAECGNGGGGGGGGKEGGEEDLRWRERAAKELVNAAIAIGSVVLLDRFRPMLLPRHLTDVHLALFQAERHLEVLARQGWGRAPSAGGKRLLPDRVSSDGGDSEAEAELRRLLLLLPLMGCGPSASSYSSTVSGTLAVGNLKSGMPPMPLSLSPIDRHSAARAYQTLLLGGASATPPWLRSRVGRLLTTLASSDLRPVVDVFVHAVSSLHSEAGGGDATGAAARLASALCAAPFPSAGELETKKTAGDESSLYQYYGRLCGQLVSLLTLPPRVSGGGGRAEKGNAKGGGADVEQRLAAGVLTVWAVVAALPKGVLRAFFLPRLVGGMGVVPDGGGNSDTRLTTVPVAVSVRRLCALLSRPPAACDTGTVDKACDLLLAPVVVPSSKRAPAVPECDDGDKSGASSSSLPSSFADATVLAQLTRVACADAAVRTDLRDDAAWAIRMAVRLLLRRGVRDAAAALVEAASANALDAAGYAFQYRSLSGADKGCGGGGGGGIERLNPPLELTLVLAEPADTEESRLLGETDRRARFVVEEVLSPATKLVDNAKADGGRGVEDVVVPSEEDQAIVALPGVMFHLLLFTYFYALTDQSSFSLESNGPSIKSTAPEATLHDRGSTKMTSMVMLPLLCENCSPAALLLGDEAATNGQRMGGGILGMIKVVLRCSSSRFGAQEDVTCVREEDPMDVTHFDRDDRESLLSMTSLVLSLLVAMLELGSEKRSKKEEESLLSMMPFLHALAVTHGPERLGLFVDAATNGAGELSSMLAESSEMASHAMALISSRSAMQTAAMRPGTSKTLSANEQLFERIEQAETDLRSNEPPLRAKGVVSLRHIARAYLEDSKGRNETAINVPSSSQVNGHPLIVEIDSNGDSLDNEISCSIMENRVTVLLDLVRICIIALADSESYVFLAAIQTLVAIGDAAPSEVLPLLGQAVSVGSVQLVEIKSLSDAVKVKSILSLQQRIKLTEALLFSIRRRGRGVYGHSRLLFDMMIYGCNRPDSDDRNGKRCTENADHIIQSQTHKYFEHGTELDEDRSEDVNVLMEERGVRVNTGGPVFDLEEEDVVRAACIAVVTELVAASEPAVVAKYCHAIVRLGNEALRLDATRPVRRAAALLCRDLYASVLRESSSAAEAHGAPKSSSLAVEMVLSGEDPLQTTLKRCVAGEDVVVRDSVAPNGTNIRLYDPATVVRCQEALDLCAECHALGIFTTAKMIAFSKTREENDPVVQVIHRVLNISGGRESTMTASCRLEIDSDELQLKEN